MRTLKWKLLAGVTGLTLGCGRIADEAPDTGAQTSPSPASASSQYVLVFSGDEPTGTHIGLYTNLAFSIDRNQPMREFFAPHPEEEQLPGLLKSFDLVDCSGGRAVALEQRVKDFPRGELAEVESIDIEGIPEPDWTGGACVGYRTASGSWTWNFAVSAFSYDASIDRWKAHLDGVRGSVDAVKIAFQMKAPAIKITRIVYTAHSPSGAP